MDCPVCGKQLRPGVVFCTGCGTKIGQQIGAPIPGAQTPAPGMQPPMPGMNQPPFPSAQPPAPGMPPSPMPGAQRQPVANPYPGKKQPQKPQWVTTYKAKPARSFGNPVPPPEPPPKPQFQKPGSFMNPGMGAQAGLPGLGYNNPHSGNSATPQRPEGLGFEPPPSLGGHASGAETPLHKAVTSTNAYLVETLLTSGADINARNPDGNTPLYLAVFVQDVKIVEFLLSNFALVDTRNKHGFTALHLVAFLAKRSPVSNTSLNRKIEIAEVLLARRANINAKDDDGLTPLHLAAGRGNVEMAQFLVKKGADVNAGNSTGRTPMYYTTPEGTRIFKRLLIKRGYADNDKDAEGLPMIVPFSDHHKILTNFFREQGARLSV